MTGRTVIVTGANSGLGLETVVALARAGATVVLCARDPERGAGALDRARRRSGSDRIELASLDLASVASIGAFAEWFGATHERLDVLVNNAGLVLDDWRLSDDGLEMTMAVNHLGAHLLTRLLVDRLIASAPSRVVNVASVAHRFVTQPLAAEDLWSGAARRGDPTSTAWSLRGAAEETVRREQVQSALPLTVVGGTDPFLQYCRSKLATILFTREAARRLGPHGVTVACCHPGLVRSGFGGGGDHAGIGVLVATMGWLVLIGPRRGARTQIRLAGAPDVERFAGAYVVRGHVHRPSRLARDDAHAAWLWDESERVLASIGAGPGTGPGAGPGTGPGSGG